MNTTRLQLPLPGQLPASLTLPQPLTAESLRQLERALASALGHLHRELRGDATDAGEIEYASWMQYLGRTEQSSCPQ